MRTFHLTSPEMRGEDVRNLQNILNERLAHYKSRTRIKENGVYDRETAHAVAVIAKAMGLRHYDGVPAVTKVIEHPHLRSPSDVLAEHQRAKAAKEAAFIAKGAGGLAAIPALAAHYLDVKENPPRSNWGKPFPAKWEENFGFDSGVSWCACFACSMVNQAGGHVSGGVAFCPNIEAFARAGINGFAEWKPNHGEGVGPGWLALYNFVGGSEAEHVGVVEKILPTHLVAIEGNTSGTNPADGGMVARMERPYSYVLGYARPRI
jgi:hypothetical protein